MAPELKPLHAPWTMAFSYTRTAGPVVGRFLSGLRDRRVLGLRDATGRVHVPPSEHLATGEWVEVGQAGSIESFAFVEKPLPSHPRKEPFAWVLVRLDGADTCLLHVISAPGARELRSGQRVRVQWAEERTGHITDIAGFVLASEDPREPTRPHEPGALPELSSLRFVQPLALHYRVNAGFALSDHLRALAQGRFLGKRCARCARVYIPPLGACAICASPTFESVELADHGTVTTFCIVNLPVRGQDIPLPFACANVLLDDADTPFLALIQEIDPHEVRQGMRVVAVWKEPAQRSESLDSLRYFKPNGEPDQELTALEATRRSVHRA